MPRQYTRTPLGVRFWSKVDRRGPDECWPWLGYRRKGGYGEMSVRNEDDTKWVTRLANRIAYELHYGPIPPGLGALHTCDNPPCCNPAHLYAGTAKNNIDDTIARGRFRTNGLYGERIGTSKLTGDIVLAIRARYAAGGVSYSALSREYGVSVVSVRNAVLRRTWKHV